MITSVYIHIPFCEKICHYCDFTKFFYDEKMADDYLLALENEIKTTMVEKQEMETIFIGGGTPTALNARQLKQLLRIVEQYFSFAPNCEYTFEANPGDLTKEKIKLLKNAGVNRISMGVQDLNDEMLEQLGRLHRVKDVYQNINDLQKEGLNNISIDLMYALPNQTFEHFDQTLQEALQFDLPHYSAYSLQIEPKTIFYQRYKKGKLVKPPEEIEADMYAHLRKEMNSKGIKQYEISNFSKKGFESKHNLTYWNNNYYYGFGAGSHGYLPGKRIINVRPHPTYVQKAMETGVPILHIEEISEKERVEEEMFLGLRKSEGVSLKEFEKKYHISINELYKNDLDVFLERGWIEINEDYIKLTELGKPFGNEVFQAFLLDEEDLVFLR